MNLPNTREIDTMQQRLQQLRRENFTMKKEIGEIKSMLAQAAAKPTGASRTAAVVKTAEVKKAAAVVKTAAAKKAPVKKKAVKWPGTLGVRCPKTRKPALGRAHRPDFRVGCIRASAVTSFCRIGGPIAEHDA